MVSVVMVPFPAQGHLNQLLHLSLLLSSHGLTIHFACSAIHNRQARDRLHGWQPDAINDITFHDLPFPPFSRPPPDRNSDVKFPSHLLPLFEASVQLQTPFASLLRSISATSRRVIVIHDPIMSFACTEAASHPNTEFYSYHCVPAFFSLGIIYMRQGKLSKLGAKQIPDFVVTPLDEGIPSEVVSFVAANVPYMNAGAKEAGALINTCRAIEGEFIDLLGQEPLFCRGKFFAVGPVNPICSSHKMIDHGSRHECLEWLDKQAPESVVYVAFGSMTSVSDEQVVELALGLERSGQPFIWVLRDADAGDIYADGEKRIKGARVPSEYEQRVAGVGMVVRDWAPQLEILAHRATGLFVSHCGWNSCMEGMSVGVPILAWPMHSDQPRNAMALTEYWKVGVMVREWARRQEVVPAATIEEAIKRVMVDEEGKEIRRRAKVLGDAIKDAVSEGGSSDADLKSFVELITREGRA